MDRSRSLPSAGPESAPPVVTRAIAAEAAVWVARLHGPSRSRAMERECLAWQAKSPAHRHAFERCTETWMDVPSVTVAGAFAAADAAAEDFADAGGVPSVLGGSGWAGPTEGKRLSRRWMGLSVVALATVGVLVWQPWRDIDSYRTGVGELQTVLLSDGTRLSLNTDTRVRVEFGAAQRSISVERGEALFEVAKNAQRPFVVRVAGSEVTALGTVFAVRLVPRGPGANEALAVTLIEGQVSLRPAAVGAFGGAASELAPEQPVLMKPGERVRLVKATVGSMRAMQQVDRPRIEQVVAWTRSEAQFENVSLAEAVAEMNRYSRTPIVLAGDLAGATWRVSGQYRAGDNPGFARAVAALHGLALKEGQGRLELARMP